MSSEITIHPRKLSRPRRIEHTMNNAGETLNSVASMVMDLQNRMEDSASATEVRELRGSLDEFREAFSGERRAAVSVNLKVDTLYGPHGTVAKLDSKVDDLAATIDTLGTQVVRAIAWGTGALAAIGTGLGLVRLLFK